MLKPAAYRWRWSKGQKFQLAHTEPRPLQKMGRLRPQPDVEPLYDQATVQELVAALETVSTLLGDHPMVGLDELVTAAFEHVEDTLAPIRTNKT